MDLKPQLHPACVVIYSFAADVGQPPLSILTQRDEYLSLVFMIGAPSNKILQQPTKGHELIGEVPMVPGAADDYHRPWGRIARTWRGKGLCQRPSRHPLQRTKQMRANQQTLDLSSRLKHLSFWRWRWPCRALPGHAI